MKPAADSPLQAKHGVPETDARSGAPLRVLHVINTLSAGGAEVLVTELAIALSQYCDVKVWTYGGVHDAKGKALCARLKQADIEVTSAGISTRSQMIAIPALLARYVNRYRPHIVHAHLEHSELFAALSMYLCRPRPLLIRSTHSTRLLLTLTRMLRPWLTSRFDWSVAVSNAVLNSPEHGLPKSRACVIDNGISLPALGNRAVLRQKLRTALHVPAGRKMLVQIGSMRGAQNPKAHDVVIEAFAAGGFMRTSDLVFLGDGPGRAELEARSKELGVQSAVHFCGIVEEPAPYILAADVLLMPSRYEGFGLVAAEAACLGAPMVLSDIDSLKIFVNNTTSLCAPGDVGSLIAAMRHSLDRCDELWEEGDRLIPAFREKFDITGVARKYFETYRRLTACGAASSNG